ncbi:MAG: DNA polymerase III subunit beta [Patescibacteria group bacterium]|nr:DNA polymerase III subunit beta [Patescibacteria group bacterium]
MKLIILRNNLLRAFGTEERVISNNVNLPILKNIFLEAQEGKIILTATDLELAIQYNLSGKIIESGSVVMPFFIINSIIKNLTSERVNIEEKEKKIFLSTDNYEAVIQGQSPKEFPIIPSIHNNKQFVKISVAFLKEALENVIGATQYSEIRPEISGVFVKFFDEKMFFVATDSFRLAEKSLGKNQFQTSFDNFSAIIPLKTAEELLRALSGLDGDDENVEIFIDLNQILFKTNVWQITSRLIDGKFPEYQGVIPKETKTEVTLNKQEFINAIKLTSTFAGRTQDVSIKSGENRKYIELTSSDSSLGENKYQVLSKVKGEKVSVTFNWRYLIEGLKIYKSEEIVLGANLTGPAVIKNPNDNSLIYVLMPIKN